MAVNFVQKGERLLYLNSTTQVIEPGTVVAFGTVAGVSVNAIDPGREGPVQLTGVWALPCALDAAVTRGARVYLDSATGEITDTDTGNIAAGIAAGDYPASATTMEVRIG